MNPALAERKRQLADEHIQGPEKKAIFLTKATRFKMPEESKCVNSNLFRAGGKRVGFTEIKNNLL